MNRSQRRQIERTLGKQPQPVAAPAAEEVAEPKVAGEIDGVSYDERGNLILSDEERELLGDVAPRTPDQHHSDLAARLYATETELRATRELLAHRTVQLVKASRRAKELLGQLNATAAPPAETPAAS